jgi:hypothetical protein
MILPSFGAGTYVAQADLVLAKYTCLALLRLNGSVKKVKGGLRKSVTSRIDF